MRVEHFGGADVFLAHDGGGAREQQFELLRFGRNGDEEAILRRARLYRLGAQRELRDRRAGRMRGEIELEKFEQDSRVLHWDGQFERADKNTLTTETQRHRGTNFLIYFRFLCVSVPLLWIFRIFDEIQLTGQANLVGRERTRSQP